MALIDPAKPENQVKILFQLLDSDNNQLLGWLKNFLLIVLKKILILKKAFKEFVYLPDLLNYPVTEVKDRLTIYEIYAPKIYNSKYSQIVRRFVYHEYKLTKEN